MPSTFGNLIISLAMSQHLGTSDYEFNSIHPSLRYEFAQGASLGVYYNSEHRISPFISKRFKHQDFMAEIAVMGGYKAAPIVANIRLGYSLNDQFTIFAAPAVDGEGNALLVMGVEMDIKSWTFKF